jgi:thioredoxin-like negative regulator of GroEL
MSKILKMSASWCSPCATMDVQIQTLGVDYESLVEHIDIDKNPELAKQYGIRSIPTLIKLDDSGQEVARSVGSIPLTKLAAFIK